MRALAVGDLHLGAGSDYGRAPGDRLAEQQQTWADALALAREAQSDVILFAGDAFHKARPTPEELLEFERPLIAHRAAGGAPVVAVIGNHDLASTLHGTGLEVFAEAGLLTLARDPQTIQAPGDVTVACLPWAPPTRLVAQAGGGDRDDIHQAAADLLLDVARGLRASIVGPAILLTHFSISGTVTADGADVGLFRETVLDVDALAATGFDLVVAGHIHKPQQFPGGLYTGSPLPLNFGEAKSDHGVWIIDIDGGTVESSFVPLASRRFVTLDAQASDLVIDGKTALYPTDGVRDAIVKVRISATGEQARRLDIGQVKRDLIDRGAYKVWSVQLDVTREERARVAGLDETLDEISAFDMYLAARGINGSRGDRLRDLTLAYLEEARS